MTAETFDDFSDLTPEDIEAKGGPLTGSRGTNRSGGTRSTATRSTRLQKKLDQLQVRLSKEMFMGGGMIGMGLPVTGYYICQESDSFTKAVIELAQTKPEWVEALEQIANIGPGMIVGRTVLGMGASLRMDRLRKEPQKQEEFADRQFMKFLGVTQAYLAVKGEGRGQSDGTSSYVPPPHGTFVPVS